MAKIIESKNPIKNIETIEFEDKDRVKKEKEKRERKDNRYNE